MPVPLITRREFSYGMLLSAARSLLLQIKQNPDQAAAVDAGAPTVAAPETGKRQDSESLSTQISNIVSSAISEAQNSFNDQLSIIGHLGFSATAALGPSGVTISGGVMAGYNPSTTEINVGGYASISTESVQSVTPQASAGFNAGVGVGSPKEGSMESRPKLAFRLRCQPQELQLQLVRYRTIHTRALMSRWEKGYLLRRPHRREHRRPSDRLHPLILPLPSKTSTTLFFTRLKTPCRLQVCQTARSA